MSSENPEEIVPGCIYLFFRLNCFLMTLIPLQKSLFRFRSAEEEALDLIHAMIHQEDCFFPGLHSFGQSSDVCLLCKIQDLCNQKLSLLVALLHCFQELLIQLDHIKVIIAQNIQRRILTAEVIQPYPESGISAFLDDLFQKLRVSADRTFRDLNDQILRSIPASSILLASLSIISQTVKSRSDRLMETGTRGMPFCCFLRML